MEGETVGRQVVYGEDRRVDFVVQLFSLRVLDDGPGRRGDPVPSQSKMTSSTHIWLDFSEGINHYSNDTN